jgi:hypothetical protein
MISLRSQFLDLLHNLAGQDRLWTKPHPLSLGLFDAVLLTLSSDAFEFAIRARTPMISFPVREVVSMLGSSITLKARRHPL